jgi:hypothetical protein
MDAGCETPPPQCRPEDCATTKSRSLRPALFVAPILTARSPRLPPLTMFGATRHRQFAGAHSRNCQKWHARSTHRKHRPLAIAVGIAEPAQTSHVHCCTAGASSAAIPSHRRSAGSTGIHCDSRSESHQRPRGRPPWAKNSLGCQMVDASGRPMTARRAGVPGMTFRGAPSLRVSCRFESSKRHAGLPRGAPWGKGASKARDRRDTGPSRAAR